MFQHRQVSKSSPDNFIPQQFKAGEAAREGKKKYFRYLIGFTPYGFPIGLLLRAMRGTDSKAEERNSLLEESRLGVEDNAVTWH